MKLKMKYPKILISVCSCIIFCSIILSACSSNNIKNSDSSIAMIKNASMSTYGTGFAIGTPGKPVDTILTSYSVVATPNGVPPQNAIVRINEAEKDVFANVVFYDVGRNIAILKLPECSKELKAMVFEDTVDCNKTVYARGYDGTGNIMSDFETFNTTDIIQYSGHIRTYDELNTMVVYQYSNEFNRALVGAPAMDEKGTVIGMCAYSLNSMNTYSQYILSSDELSKLFDSQNIDYMTSDEVKYKNIIFLSVITGLFVLIAIILSTLIIGNKKENNLKFQDQYIRITDGTLKGKIYPFHGKLTIGRDAAKCDIVYPIDEPGISGLHCTIQMEGKDCYLVDRFSKYGTFLENGTKITSSLPYKIEEKPFAFYIAEPKNRFELIDKKEIEE